MRPMDITKLFWVACLLVIHQSGSAAGAGSSNEDFPEGYFPFEESPARIPPKVRRPPYAQADVDCPGVGPTSSGSEAVQTLDNLCGDLNKGYIPKSPFKQSVNGQSYPFELIRNKTLDFFSSTLPVLKEDKNLPKVAKYEDFEVIDRRDKLMKRIGFRNKREQSSSETSDTVEGVDTFSNRQSRGLCDKNYGIVCTIFNVLSGRLMNSLHNQLERVENPELLPSPNNINKNTVGDEPMTPCPSAAEYVTPVYAKNYQGVWRYVVQIPYEGYFTQTVEVTKCLRKKCYFMDGSCLASPRWVSLLVAELFYPHARFPATRPGTSFRSFSNRRHSSLIPPVALPPADITYIPRSPTMEAEVDVEETTTEEEGGQSNDEDQSADRSKRNVIGDKGAGASAANKPTYCDGVDEIGCFQVRLYYDWFLVPGSCKCWKQDFFTKYGRKRRK